MGNGVNIMGTDQRGGRADGKIVIQVIVREQVYSRGKLVLKASHWSR